MSVRYSYNRQVSPAAPFVHITLSRPTASEVRVSQVRVLAHPDESYMLLGRDLLNQFEIVLNGPKLFVELA